MDELKGFLGAEVAARGTQVVIVEMPNQTGPGVVEHPLDDARGSVLVAAVRLEHGTLTFVGHLLRLPNKVGYVPGFAVALLDRASEDPDVFELPATGMEIPVVIDGPQLVRRKHGLQFFKRRDSGSGTGLRVEAEGAAGSCAEQPVVRGDIVVGSSHFHAGRTGQFGFFSRGRGNDGLWPVDFLFDVEIGALAVGGRRVVAALEPDEDARMFAEAQELIAERFDRNAAVLVVPLAPFLPSVAAAPARHD